MNFLASQTLTAITLAASVAIALPTKAPSEPPRATMVDVPKLRLAWFNSLDRSFSLSAVAGTVTVTLHSTSGTQIALLHKGYVAERDIFRVSEDLPPGVYVLSIRQDDKQALERITLF